MGVDPLAALEAADVRFAADGVRAVHQAMTAEADGKDLWLRRLNLELVETARNGAFVTSRYAVRGPLTEDAPHPEVMGGALS